MFAFSGGSDLLSILKVLRAMEWRQFRLIRQAIWPETRYPMFRIPDAFCCLLLAIVNELQNDRFQDPWKSVAPNEPQLPVSDRATLMTAPPVSRPMHCRPVKLSWLKTLFVPVKMPPGYSSRKPIIMLQPIQNRERDRLRFPLLLRNWD